MSSKIIPNGENPALRYVTPYYFAYSTFAKRRWVGRELLEVISTEYRDRSIEYYRHAVDAGVTTINGKIATAHQVLKEGNRIRNLVHRHEPPISSHPIDIVYRSPDNNFIVIDKPGGMPVHPTGRYTKHSATWILENEFGVEKAFTVNRLDRLTSGLMFIALNSKTAGSISDQFIAGTVHKEYVARVRGEFPEGDIICDQPMITVDKQTGLVIITPEGKPAITKFKRMFYDKERDESVVSCWPQTGRTHQIRVHLQYLGHAIPNDPLYALKSVWEGVGIEGSYGKGGVDLTPASHTISLPDYAPPTGHAAASTSSLLGTPVTSEPGSPAVELDSKGANENQDDFLKRMKHGESLKGKLLPRETGEDIGSSSPIRLSLEARELIRKLRRMKDEADDWSRYKDIVLYTEEESTLVPGGPPPRESLVETLRRNTAQIITPLLDTDISNQPIPQPLLLPSKEDSNAFIAPEGFCQRCFMPLQADPDPDSLFIYLHAMRYVTDLGDYETRTPVWATNDWDGRVDRRGVDKAVSKMEEMSLSRG